MFKELILTVIVLSVLFIIIQITKNKRYGKVFVFAALVFYTGILIYATAFKGGRIGLSGVSIKFPLPFWRAIKAGHYGLTTNRSVLNVLLFVPFGYLFPFIWNLLSRKQNNAIKVWIVLLLGFLASLIVESCQLVFHFGVFELDGLVKNTMGVGFGYLGYWLLNHSSSK